MAQLRLNSSKIVKGTFMDSENTYFQRTPALAEIGLVLVGDVNGVSPKCRARIESRSM